MFSRRTRSAYRLVLVDQGGTRLPRAASGQQPLQVDLGSGADGRAEGVFVACDRRCTLSTIDPTTAIATRLSAAAACDERPSWPTVHRGIVTYACAVDDATRLYTTRSSDPGAAARELASIPGRVKALDSGAAGVVYVSTATSGDRAHASSVLRLRAPDGRTRVIARGNSGEEGGSEIVSPTLAGPFVYWGTTEGEPARGFRGKVHRLDRRTGTEEVLDVPGGALFSVSSDSSDARSAVLADFETGGPAGYDPDYDRQVLRRLFIERFYRMP